MKIVITLDGEIPTLTATSVRAGSMNRKANIMVHAKKKRMQEAWREKIAVSGRLPDIHQLQRDCAAAGRLIRLKVTAYRRRQLDMKNLYRACDELLLDPLQRPREDPVIYNDRPSNIDWSPTQIIERDKNACKVVMVWWMSADQPCGATTKRRYREEGKNL